MKIIELCNLLGIANEVQEKIIELEKYIDFKNMEYEIEQMKQPSSWDVALERLKCLLGSDEDGMKILTCQLQCACDAYAKYEEIGISKEIFIDTMKFFPDFCKIIRRNMETIVMFGHGGQFVKFQW
jgi:hypothetical protein